ncbi:hypothetical protein BpHYR1_024528 [Brachionus plicatilis]|uniref:Uncharacterized protein n=1 Tax=Brachionus plicatilis TaxID=10195 RepID=A0A3M7RAR6_BRAPC|nr:hypothetical protein BpHYR1_024528 [Brachionus plicatilis]
MNSFPSKCLSIHVPTSSLPDTIQADTARSKSSLYYQKKLLPGSSFLTDESFKKNQDLAEHEFIKFEI